MTVRDRSLRTRCHCEKRRDPGETLQMTWCGGQGSGDPESPTLQFYRMMTLETTLQRQSNTRFGAGTPLASQAKIVISTSSTVAGIS